MGLDGKCLKGGLAGGLMDRDGVHGCGVLSCLFLGPFLNGTEYIMYCTIACISWVELGVGVLVGVDIWLVDW